MRKFFASFLVFTFVFLALSVTRVSAKIITSQNGNVSVPRTEVVNDDLFIGAQTVEIDGMVNGDVFVGAQTVKITGVINGNLHVGATTLDLGGNVKGNVYAGAQNILVSGSTIGGSLLVGAATVNVDNDSSVGGSILAGAGMLTIDSRVERSVYAGTGKLTIGSNAVIGRDLYYAESDQNKANISSSAVISGSVFKSEISSAQQNANLQAAKKQFPAFMNIARTFATFTSLIGALIVGFLYFKLFGKNLAESSSLISNSFWKSFGVGFLVSIAFVPGLIILLITVVGIPVAGLAILLLLIYMYLAKIVVALPLGNFISQKIHWRMSTYGALAFGILTIYILRIIPVVGFLSGLIVLWAGLGALTLRMFSKSNSGNL